MKALIPDFWKALARKLAEKHLPGNVPAQEALYSDALRAFEYIGAEVAQAILANIPDTKALALNMTADWSQDDKAAYAEKLAKAMAEEGHSQSDIDSAVASFWSDMAKQLNS